MTPNLKFFFLSQERLESMLALIEQADKGKRLYRSACHLIRDVIHQVQKEPVTRLFNDGNIRAEEDFCQGCDNFDAFFNGCKLTSYEVTIGKKKEKILPRSNDTRWLLAVVGCASDTRKKHE